MRCYRLVIRSEEGRQDVHVRKKEERKEEEKKKKKKRERERKKSYKDV